MVGIDGEHVPTIIELGVEQLGENRRLQIPDYDTLGLSARAGYGLGDDPIDAATANDGTLCDDLAGKRSTEPFLLADGDAHVLPARRQRCAVQVSDLDDLKVGASVVGLLNEVPNGG